MVLEQYDQLRLYLDSQLPSQKCLKPHLLVMISCVEACYQKILVCVLFWTIYRAINQDFCFKVCYYFNDMFAANKICVVFRQDILEASQMFF